MVFEALIITCIGMGGVFLFLFLLICAMQILRIIVDNQNDIQNMDKIAAAIAVVHHQK